MPKLSFQIQDFSRGYAPRSMCRAVWPRTVKILQDGIDEQLLGEMADHGLKLVVLRQTHQENGDPREAWERVTDLLQLTARLRFLLARGVEVALEFPYNEELQTSPEGISQLATITLNQGQRILDAGFSLVVGIFSEGNPSNLDWWLNFRPALRWARARWSVRQRVYLGLHEYSTPRVGGPFDGWHEGRYRKVWEILPDDCKIPILIVEGGIDGGIDGRREVGWRGYKTAAQYAQWCQQRADHFDVDSYVWYVFDFLCGGNDQWASFDIQDEVDLRDVYTPGTERTKWYPGTAALTPGDPTVQFDLGQGFRKMVPLLGAPDEAEVYHFAGSGDEASLTSFKDGSAHWDHSANVTVGIRRSDKAVFVDWGDGPKKFTHQQ